MSKRMLIAALLRRITALEDALKAVLYEHGLDGFADDINRQRGNYQRECGVTTADEMPTEAP